jgi:hypothetical protein
VTMDCRYSVHWSTCANCWSWWNSKSQLFTVEVYFFHIRDHPFMCAYERLGILCSSRPTSFCFVVTLISRSLDYLLFKWWMGKMTLLVQKWHVKSILIHFKNVVADHI